MRAIIIGGCLTIVLGLCIACGGWHRNNTTPESSSEGISTSPVPADIAPSLWQQLTDELGRTLALVEGNRVSSAAPTDNASQVSDLAVTPGTGGSARFTFSYRCYGDYDQNGEVNVGDLVPIAANYLKTTAAADWTAARAADGDQNGLVNMADIVPIAQNYLVRIAGFELQYASDAGATSWAASATIDMSTGSLPMGGGFKNFTSDLASPVDQMYYRVVPYDGETNRHYGIPSTLAYFSSDMLPAPQNLQASDGTYQDRIYLTWTKVTGATGYEVFRDSTASPFASLGDVSSYDDTAVLDTAVHFYWVRATNGVEFSNLSANDTGYLGQPQTGSLDPPVGVQASDGAFEDHIYVSWQKSSNATGYEIYRDQQSQLITTTGNVAYYNDYSVADALQHTYWVKAIDAASSSDYSTPDTGYRATPATGTMVVLAWNDLGMHCMNQDFSEMMILPPYNVLHAQVINKVGGEPQIVTGGVTVRYTIPENTHSADKCNFWDYCPALLGASPAPNIGLTGHGLAGTLSPLLATEGRNDWSVTGIPITPINDAGVETPYNLAMVTVESGVNITARTEAVVPVSWEISCELCHQPASGSVASDILSKHDSMHGTDLLHAKPVLCGGCHGQPELGLASAPGVPTLSSSMHTSHATRMAQAGLVVECYACHPGIRTQCLRDVMFSAGKTCTDCHGTMAAVGNPARQPWVDEPRCGDCHNAAGHEYGQPGVLYRDSVGHNGVHCAACHGSPHAITPTIIEGDNLQAIALQGHSGMIDTCTVCHTTPPDDPFNHTLGEGGEGGD